MLYIKMGKHPDQHKTWHVGEPFPCPKSIIGNIEEIQADGDELETIKTNITGIPWARRSVISWFGDDAKFISAVLLSMYGNDLTKNLTKKRQTERIMDRGRQIDIQPCRIHPTCALSCEYRR